MFYCSADIVQYHSIVVLNGWVFYSTLLSKIRNLFEELIQDVNYNEIIVVQLLTINIICDFYAVIVRLHKNGFVICKLLNHRCRMQ